MKKIFIILLVIVVLIIGVLLLSEKDQRPKSIEPPLITDEINEDEIINTIPPQTDTKMELDITNLESIYILANKNNSLPKDYVPNDLVIPNVLVNKSDLYLKREAADALEVMFQKAQDDGINLVLGSAYRSYDYQKTLYDNYVARDGELAANRYSAKPGTSEHQTGLAVDISDYSGENFLRVNFENTEEGLWLQDNAHLYGFVLRYPQDKEEITGYMYEPWHFRYVGNELAKELYDSNLTYEEYLEME